MIVNLKRCLSILLAVMLLIGIIPTAYAVESGVDSIQSGEAVSEGTEPTDSIDPTEPTEPTEPPDIPDTQDDYAVMSVGSTQKSILLFDYADNGNYTTVLKSQVSCEYKPNGTGAARTAYIKNLGWHFARYGGVAYPDEPLYCIEPWRNYGASTSGNSVDRGVTLDGSGSTAGSNVWYAMPEDYREAIGLILLYSDRMWDHSVSVTTTKKDSNPNVPLRIATQFLIYEIVCGLRDPATFKSNSVNVCGTSGDIFYNAGEASVPYFAPKYNALVDAIHAAKKIPSFTGASVSSAPTITLTGEETSVTDSNGVLSDFSFPDGNGAKFYKSGNTLYIAQTGDISESTVYKVIALILSLTLLLCFPTGVSAAEPEDTGADTAAKGSLTIYKVDLTNAEKDGAWDSSYVSTGVYDQNVNDTLNSYALKDVEFGKVWRLTHFVEGTDCFKSATPELFEASARAFGRFQYMLQGYPAETLHETIAKFHDTEDRLRKLKAAINGGPLIRVAKCKAEIDFVLAREKDCSVALQALREGKLPLRVTHNDTKLNNILIDRAIQILLLIV